MADWSSPLTSLDPGLSEASMSNCMVAGINGWCGMSCPVLCAGKCEEVEMIEAKRDELAAEVGKANGVDVPPYTAYRMFINRYSKLTED